MVWQAGDKLFCSVRDVYQGAVNDIAVCYDKNACVRTYYTLLIVKNNAVARQMVKLFEGGEASGNSPYIMGFSQGDRFFFVFDYHEERPITEFFLGAQRSRFEREQLIQKLVMECITATGLPYPFLYLVLLQGQVSFAADGSVYFTYLLDLECLDDTCGEEPCVQETARLICRLLSSSSKRQNGKDNRMYRLVEKKTGRHAYRQWMELYRDLSLTAAPEKKPGIVMLLKNKISNYADRLFHLLLVFCILLVLAAVAAVIMQALLGEAAWFRIFYNTFWKIGTETLEHV